MPGPSGNDPLVQAFTGLIAALVPIIVALGVIIMVLKGWPKIADLLRLNRELKDREVKQHMSGATKVAGAGILVVAIVLLGGFGLTVLDQLNAEYAYRHAIGAYIDNAYDGPNFEVMKANLVSAYDGMRNESLVDSDCGRAWSWERTQDWCMGYQYQYLAGLINRTDFYLERVRSGNISQFSDVYEQMISNMRGEMVRNGPTDWVAHPAWYLKYHSIYYWYLNLWLLIVGVLLLIVGVAVLIVEV